MSGRVFFDTNILVYANDGQNPDKQNIALELVKTAMMKNTAVISVQVLSEFWVTVTQKIDEALPVPVAEHQIEVLSSMRVAELNYEIFRSALVIQKLNNLSYWDSLIISSAASEGCEIIYTEDLSNGQKIQGVEILNPFN